MKSISLFPPLAARTVDCCLCSDPYALCVCVCMCVCRQFGLASSSDNALSATHYVSSSETFKKDLNSIIII